VAEPGGKARDKILAPVLGDHYGRILSAGGIRLEREAGSFVFHCEDHEFPAAPQSMAPLLAAAAQRIHHDYLAFLADSPARLPSGSAFSSDPATTAERHRDKEVIRELLSRLCAKRFFSCFVRWNSASACNQCSFSLPFSRPPSRYSS
jgi:(1->4)-alpha-D-glucan 1-alpha-D-glucosylmutase